MFLDRSEHWVVISGGLIRYTVSNTIFSTASLAVHQNSFTRMYYAGRDTFFRLSPSQFYRRTLESATLRSPPRFLVTMDHQSALNPALRRHDQIPDTFGRPLTDDIGKRVGATSLTNELLVLGSRVSAIAEVLQNF